ncbi:MAG TPA: lipid-A-disaccharide synthase [Gemmatimonadaceae bacterium]|nr:lipid-A-disaccharide synthase [Gemmatimonadaceae bacterium]
MREVLILAGEASGDLHGAALAEKLHALRPDLALTGTGGGRMRAAGVTLLEQLDGVVGFVALLRYVPAHVALYRRIRDRLNTGDVALVVLVDYGFFNLKVGTAAKAAGVPVLYFITPQVWASRAGRMKSMARVITRAAVILPFEQDLLRANGIDATFVGHPLLDRAIAMPDRAEAKRRLGIPPEKEVLALFPGSRAGEIKRLLDDFLAVARDLERRRPGLHVVVSVAPAIQLDPARVPYQMVSSASLDILRAADVALCKSGTTTLEAAVADCPCAIVYRTGKVDYAIAKRIVKIPFIGLLNIVAGREVAPEFVQDAFQPLRVADALDPLFDPQSGARRAMLAGLAEVRAKLGEPGAAGRVAVMASELAR